MPERYSIIYKPNGRAAEYGDRAANIWDGHCDHRCRYCYVPAVLHKTREEFGQPPAPAKDCLVRVKRDCDRLQESHGKQVIFLCFTCDPFPASARDVAPSEFTTEVIGVIKDAGHNARLLTKGWVPKEALDLLDEHDEVGVTLTFRDRYLSELWEPGAASPDDRVANLIRARDHGIWTWVSFEPVIQPDSVTELIRRTERYVDRYAIGKANHLADWDWPGPPWKYVVENIDWPGFAVRVANLCRRLGKTYRLKEDLVAHLPKGMERLRESPAFHEEIRRGGEVIDLEAANIRTPVCGDCGAEMVLRKGPHGKFWGCSRWPECSGVHAAHPSGKPVGIPADEETRALRRECHDELDRVFGNDRLGRRRQATWKREHLPLAHCGQSMKEELAPAIAILRSMGASRR